MWYVKNLPRWERVVRLLSALLMGGCAWRFGATPVGLFFGAGGVVTALTALVGYCPMCALGGRRPAGKESPR